MSTRPDDEPGNQRQVDGQSQRLRPTVQCCKTILTMIDKGSGSNRDMQTKAPTIYYPYTKVEDIYSIWYIYSIYMDIYGLYGSSIIRETQFYD